MRQQTLTLTWVLLLSLPFAAFAQWTNLTNANFRKFEAQTAVHNGKIYSITGFKPALTIEKGVEVYDPATNTWTVLATMPISKYETLASEAGVTHMGVALVGDSIWVVGGRTGSNPGPLTEEVWIYNIAANTWTAGPDLPLPLAGGGMVVLDRTLFVFGGFTNACNGDQSSYHLTLDVDAWLANPATTWENSRTPMPNPRNHIGTTTLRGKIYAFGGQIGHDCCGAGIPCGVDATYADEYDPLTDSWRRIPNLPYKRSHVEAATYTMDGKVYISSSETGATTSNTTMEFNPNTQTWSIINALKLPTGVLAPIVRPIGDQVYLLSGGYGGVNNPTDSAKVITFPRTPLHHLGFTKDTLSLFVYQNESATSANHFWTVDGEANYTITTPGSPAWLTLNSSSTGIVTSNGRFLDFSVDGTGLPEGEYVAKVKITGSGPDVLAPASTISYTADSFVVVLRVGPEADGVLELASTDACEGVEIGSSASRFVSLHAPGSLNLSLSSIALSNTSVFQLTGTLPTSVTAGATTSVEVLYTPLVTGPDSTWLVVTHTGVSSPDSILLICQAVTPCVTPDNWVSTSLGSPLITGSACVSDDIYYLNAAGNDIWSSKDEGHFFGTRVVGDGEIIVRVTDIDLVSNGTKVGVMMRSNLGENSVNGFLWVSPADGVGFQYRTATGANTGQTKTNGIGTPRWLKLERVGNIVTAWQSVDGVSYTKVNGGSNPQTIALGDTIWAGLAMTSKDPTQAGDAVGESFSLDFALSAFPVELLSFDGAWMDNAVQLRWESASEEAFSHYEVTRKNDFGSFELLGKVLGEGAGEYLWVDQQPLEQRNVYRLNMVDIDGTVAYSPLLEVTHANPRPFVMEVLEEERAVELRWQTDAEPTLLRVIDITGRELLLQEATPRAGQKLRISLEGQPAGWYHLQSVGETSLVGQSFLLH